MLQKLAKAASGQWLIFRHYRHPNRARLAQALARWCRQQHACLLLAGDARLALRVGASGVHYPSRQLVGFASPHPRPRPDWRISAAVHSAREIIAAARCGADLALLSPALAAPSGGKLIHPVRFAALVNHHKSPLPIFALGGMDGVKFRRFAASGAKGWAGIRAGDKAAKI